MVKVIFDWLVVTPAQFVAGIVTLALACAPIIGGPLVGFVAYRFLVPAGLDGRYSARKWWHLVAAWAVGIYATLVFGFALIELPKAIFRFLKD